MNRHTAMKFAASFVLPVILSLVVVTDGHASGGWWVPLDKKIVPGPEQPADRTPLDPKTQAEIELQNEAATAAAGETRTQMEKIAERAEKKKIKASELHKRVKGNRAARKKAAAAINESMEQLGETAKGAGKVLGVAANVSEAGAIMLARISEGDISGATGAGAKELVEMAPSAAGAWALGGLGAKAGTLIGGPVGGIVGGSIGAVAGAAAGAVGYNMTIGDKVEDLATYLVSFPEVDPKVQAMVSRIEYTENKRVTEAYESLGLRPTSGQEAVIASSSISAPTDLLDKLPAPTPEKKQPAKRPTFWGEEPEMDIPDPLAALEEMEQKPEAKAERKKQSKKAREKELMKKATRMSAQGIMPKSSYESTPVIPATCTIDLVIWSPEYPEHKTNFSLELRGGSTSMSGTEHIDAWKNDSSDHPHSCSGTQYDWTSQGTLSGNRLHSTGSTSFRAPQVCTQTGARTERVGDELQKVPYRCESSYSMRSEYSDVMTLNIDGTFSSTLTGTNHINYRVSGHNCYWKADAYTLGDGQSWSHTNVGIWKIRDVVERDQ